MMYTYECKYYILTLVINTFPLIEQSFKSIYPSQEKTYRKKRKKRRIVTKAHFVSAHFRFYKMLIGAEGIVN
jgi:hypothetical protein